MDNYRYALDRLNTLDRLNKRQRPFNRIPRKHWPAMYLHGQHSVGEVILSRIVRDGQQVKYIVRTDGSLKLI